MGLPLLSWDDDEATSGLVRAAVWKERDIMNVDLLFLKKDRYHNFES